MTLPKLVPKNETDGGGKASDWRTDVLACTGTYYDLVPYWSKLASTAKTPECCTVTRPTWNVKSFLQRATTVPVCEHLPLPGNANQADVHYW